MWKQNGGDPQRQEQAGKHELLAQPTSFFSIGLVGGIGLLVYSILYLALGINLPERKTIIELVSNAFEAGRARMKS